MCLELTNLDYAATAGIEPDDAAAKARAACVDVAFSAFFLIDAGQAATARTLFTDDAGHTFNGVEFAGAALTKLLLDRDEQAASGRNTRHAASSTLFRLTGPGR